VVVVMPLLMVVSFRLAMQAIPANDPASSRSMARFLHRLLPVNLRLRVVKRSPVGIKRLPSKLAKC
jgi:hypothetical protein